MKARVIPVVLYNGQVVVKSIQYDKHRNIGHPVNVVRVYNAREVDELIFLDISATINNRLPNYELLRDIADECFMPLTVGGGIKSLDDVRHFLLAGADKVCLNSSAVSNPSLIRAASERFGNQCIVASIDVIKSTNGKYCVYNYVTQTSSELEPAAWARELETLGAGELFLNSVDNDGMMNGYDEDLIRLICESVSIPVIVAGGASCLDDFATAIKCGASAVGAASIFHFTEHTPIEAKRHMAQLGIATRL